MNSQDKEMIFSLWALFALLVFLVNFIVGCAHNVDKAKKSAQNFCFLDFDAEMCWTDKENNQGISFGRMKSANRVCNATDEEDALCYYGVNSDDMYDIMEIIYFKGNLCR